MKCEYGDSRIVEYGYFDVVPEILKRIQSSEKRKEYCKYIGEVVARCVKLIELEESGRAANEYKIMIKYLKKQLNI